MSGENISSGWTCIARSSSLCPTVQPKKDLCTLGCTSVIPHTPRKLDVAMLGHKWKPDQNSVQQDALVIYYVNLFSFFFQNTKFIKRIPNPHWTSHPTLIATGAAGWIHEQNSHTPDVHLILKCDLYPLSGYQMIQSCLCVYTWYFLCFLVALIEIRSVL